MAINPLKNTQRERCLHLRLAVVVMFCFYAELAQAQSPSDSSADAKQLHSHRCATFGDDDTNDIESHEPKPEETILRIDRLDNNRIAALAFAAPETRELVFLNPETSRWSPSKGHIMATVEKQAGNDQAIEIFRIGPGLFTGGKRYKLTINYRIDNFNTSGDSHLLIKVHSPNESGTELWEETFRLPTEFPNIRSHSFDFIIPAGENDYEITCYTTGPGTVSFQSPELQELPLLSEADIFSGEGLQARPETGPFEPVGLCQHLDWAPGGYGPSDMVSYTDEEVTQAIRMCEEAGLKWIRIGINWSKVEPSPGVYDATYLQRIDLILDKCDEAGIQYLITLAYAPPWARKDGLEDDWASPPKDPADYVAFVDWVLNRYGNRTRYWEIWNEPDWHFWKGTVEEYTGTFIAAAKRIHVHNPENKVLHGGLASDGVTVLGPTPANFMDRFLTEGAGKHIDIFNIHSYERDPAAIIHRINRFYKIIDAHGYGDKPIWITETGLSTVDGRDEQDQSDLVDLTYGIILRHPKVEKIFWYNFRCKGNDPDDKETRFGLVDQDLTPRPAWDHFRMAIQHHATRINPYFLEIDQPHPGQ